MRGQWSRSKLWKFPVSYLKLAANLHSVKTYSEELNPFHVSSYPPSLNPFEQEQEMAADSKTAAVELVSPPAGSRTEGSKNKLTPI